MATVKNKTKVIKQEYKVKNALVNYFLVIIFSVFPLFFTNAYSKIRHDKLYFFIITGITLIVLEAIILLFSFSDKKIGETCCKKKWYRKFSFTDYAFISLILCSSISTILSSYPMDSISGVQGRNNGLLLTAVYFCLYIIISRLFVFKKYLFPIFAFCCTIVFTLCILNFFYIDPLGMFVGYNEQIVMDFTSTIGNKNLMASFCCIAIAVFVMLFIHINNPVRFLYLFTAGLGFSALICSNSECGFLGILPTFAIILIYTSRDYSKLFRFFVCLSAILVSGKLIGVLNLIFTKNKNFGSIQQFFINSKIITVALAVCIIFIILFYFLNKNNLKAPKAIFYTLLSINILAIVTFIFLFIYFTFIDKTTPLYGVATYLRFNEKWGTHRGYIWIKSIEIFINGNLKDKLFGCGPDTFFSAFSPYFLELSEKYGNTSTNSAHNELLNYLITIGLTGLVSYITLIFSVVVRAFKNAQKNYLSVIFASAIICYFFQSLVNIAQPITTPFLFIFIALTESTQLKATADLSK